MQNAPSKASNLAPSAGASVAAIATLAFGVAAVAVTLAMLSTTVLAMVVTWSESNSFNHCFLILPIAAYLAWRRKAELANATISPEWRGGIAVALGSLAWLLGDATGTLIVQELSVIVIIQALVLTIYGQAVFRILLFPLVYLFFAVPFGLELIPPLQTATALLSVDLLKLVSVPVFSDGYLISVPTGDWYVADACSGIRYVISSLALGGLFAGMMYVTWWRRALVMVIAIIVPILANGIRAFGIILLAYLSDNELATGVDHLIYGWFFFTLVSCVVLAVGMTFREAVPAPQHQHPRTAQLASLVPCLLAGSSALFLVGAARAYGDYVESAPEKRTIHIAAPEVAGYRPGNDDVNDRLLPSLSGADAVLRAAYLNSEGPLYLRVGYYLRERRDAQAVSLNHELYGAPEMLIVAKGSVRETVGGEPTSVHYQRIWTGSSGRIIWYWYWVDGHITGDPYFAKLLETKAKLLGGQQAAAIIAIAANYRADPKEAENSLRDFALRSASLYPALERAQLP